VLCHNSLDTLDERAGQELISAQHTPVQLLPRNFLRPCLLLLLREHPSHGYDLHERLRSLDPRPSDAGRLYRALRALEGDGLVRSVWEKSAVGPDRRTYQLTRPGMESLHESAQALRGTDQTVGVFLSRYLEFVALDRHTDETARR
jgi:poly-beta-hydroxybutyrate-responsive repressor